MVVAISEFAVGEVYYSKWRYRGSVAGCAIRWRLLGLRGGYERSVLNAMEWDGTDGRNWA